MCLCSTRPHAGRHRIQGSSVTPELQAKLEDLNRVAGEVRERCERLKSFFEKMEAIHAKFTQAETER